MATINVKDFKVIYTDNFFFDTNVWLLLFGTIAEYELRSQRLYSKFLESLISTNNFIYINSTIASEFANVILRRDFNLWVSNNKLVNQDFKRDFVGSATYQDSVNSISILLNKILKLPNVQRISDSFHNVHIENILTNFKIVDFNDSYIYAISLANNYKIVTNDKDFQKLHGSIVIITTQIA